MQIKNMMSCCPLPTKLATTKRKKTSVRIWDLVHCWWEHKMGQPLWKAVRQFLNELNIEQSRNSISGNEKLKYHVWWLMFRAHQNVGAIQGSVFGGAEEPNAVYQHSGVLLGLEKEGAT